MSYSVAVATAPREHHEAAVARDADGGFVGPGELQPEHAVGLPKPMPANPPGVKTICGPQTSQLLLYQVW